MKEVQDIGTNLNKVKARCSVCDLQVPAYYTCKFKGAAGKVCAYCLPQIVGPTAETLERDYRV